jgi:hypothetical protein
LKNQNHHWQEQTVSLPFLVHTHFSLGLHDCSRRRRFDQISEAVRSWCDQPFHWAGTGQTEISAMDQIVIGVNKSWPTFTNWLFSYFFQHQEMRPRATSAETFAV